MPFVLNAVLRGQLGGHTAAWRVSRADVTANTTLEYWSELGRVLEEAVFDALFLADTLAVPDDPASPLQWPLDPFILVAALAGSTEHLGLVATHSTTFNEPFTTARQLASIDHLTRGRAGWNVVTSTDDNSARNYGRDRLPEHDLRYEVAQDYVTAVIALLSAWEPDPFVADRESGELLRRDAVREVNHHGPHYRVRGPLHTTRSPQTVPLIAQAGGSPSGIDLAGRFADVVYTRQPDLQGSVDYRRRVRAAAVGHGRAADDVRVLPGVVPVVGASRDAALQRVHDLQAADTVARDRFDHAPTGPQAESSGHRLLAGTALQIADDLTRWYEAGALDGVSVHVNVLPDDLEAFAASVLPILRSRGLVREEYAPGTLRERLGLPAPRVDESAFGPRWSEPVRT
ncbi:NtaA/DmoA family FMN-dependent monooxygenase [Kineococcus rhizosphaerae]|uniref:FMN-dependent oxidoreductase (Nitrilotriacetate monooxygenase family) n=1 Tax=Kineococcus rhizosphaerae TaxID=559628 RepID=A0A2T0R188_9ACTN|nr:NtaA/DmoA family FMN-dependent monooxygenase [Kineococcus rhizosphaerae]PRY13057.1 FMN-dependent oxidoreductase (nitrilotriacetate monooxygenase family) [Kineococcus rhizosphaerae]